MRRKSLLVTLVLAAAWVPAFATPAPSVQPPQYELRIERQSLSSALQEFAKQSGVQIIFFSRVTDGHEAAPLSGKFTAVAALARLLNDAPELAFRELNANTIEVLPKDAVNRLDGAYASSTRGGGTGEGAMTEGERTAKSFWSRFRLTQGNNNQRPQNSDTNSRSGAQTESSSTQGESRSQLEEVIVTAQKREERLIDVPQAVTILSADDLTDSGALQFRDYVASVPGLNIQTQGAGFTQISMRGVTLGGDVSPTVGIYVDEVPYGSSSSLTFGRLLALDSALFDLERIEVLKGPQGTIYGASTMGGLIKYVSKAPSTEGFSGQVQAGLADTYYGGMNYNGAAMVNAPIITDKLAVRVSGFYSRDGGYIDNVALGEKDVNRSNIYGGRADLLFTPTEALSIRLTAFSQNVDRDGIGNADYAFSGAPPYGDLAQNRLTAEPFEQRFRVGSGTVVYDLDWVTFTSITSYQTGRSAFTQDFTQQNAPLAQRLFGGSYSGISLSSSGPTDRFVQELRLASEGSRPVEWVIGGFYTREASSLDQTFLLFDLVGNLTPDNLFSISVPSRFKEYAGFGTLTWHLTDKLNVSGGIRYARNDEKVTQNGSGALGVSRPTARSSENVATYLANARYHFSDRATGYLRYATGYRPGGPNFVIPSAITGVFPGPESFESDSLKSYEIGFKGETESRRFGIDLAAFQIDWDDMVLFIFRDGVPFRDNAPGGARVRGAELTLTARSTNASTVTGTLAYLDTEMREANRDVGAAKGERLPNVPRISAALNADYRLPVANLQPTVGATLRYVDERMASFDGNTFNPQYRISDYTTVDMRAGVTLGAVDAQLYVRNLFDERGQLSVVPRTGVLWSAIVQPRTVGVIVSTTF